MRYAISSLSSCANRFRWFVESAHFAIQFNSRINSYYQRKKAKSKTVIAIKAVAHKLCRACYYIVRDRVVFDVNKAFGQK